MTPATFDHLTPDLVIAAVESVFDLRLDGTIEPFPSYVNRVFGVRTDEERELVVKFYRPGRWPVETIGEEHEFLFELAEADIPVVPPLRDDDGDSVFELEIAGSEIGDAETDLPVIAFAVFPKRGGRGFDAEGDEEWFRLGSLVGRVHQIGLRQGAPERLTVDSSTWTGPFVRELTENGMVHPEFVEAFHDLVWSVIESVQPLFTGISLQRIHGDCHRGNILERPGEGLLLIDFDDMMVGPAVQDLWLLLPDHADACTRELTMLEDGYSQFRALDRRELELIEPLRFMRMIHFLAWRGRQRHDHWFQQQFPEWGNHAFWVREMEDLKDQAQYCLPR
jgi:Ser/Thr protein kinase RdoA (MazF antagonist)